MGMQATRRAMSLLGKYRSKLSRQQIKTLRGQILAGDIDGAMRGLDMTLSRKAKRAGGETDMIHCDICPYCKDLYPDRVDSYGNHFKICGMTGNMVYTEPGRIKRVSGHGWIHYGIGSCRLFKTIDEVLDHMTEIERQRYYERMNQDV